MSRGLLGPYYVNMGKIYVFPTISTGLGHLRVTSAIIDSSPDGASLYLFDTKSKAASYLHLLTSRNPLLRRVLLWTQNGVPELVFTLIYKYVLCKSSQSMAKRLGSYIRKLPKGDIELVCTHFGIAHQVSHQKDYLEKFTGRKVKVTTVVTDDSPQLLWAVECDLLVAPSLKTANKLEKNLSRGKTKVVVCDYPLSPWIKVGLTAKERVLRFEQLIFKREVNVLIPISGAAVHLDWYRSFIESVEKLNLSAKFYIVSRSGKSTKLFLDWAKDRPDCQVYSDKSDWEVIKIYNRLIHENVFACEITKPSEHTFKSILSINQRGGMPMLFASPVGRQEYDNLDFVKRLGLLNKRNHLLSSDPKIASRQLKDLLNKVGELGKIDSLKPSSGHIWSYL